MDRKAKEMIAKLKSEGTEIPVASSVSSSSHMPTEDVSSVYNYSEVDLN